MTFGLRPALTQHAMQRKMPADFERQPMGANHAN
jgi:hypothetical protein